MFAPVPPPQHQLPVSPDQVGRSAQILVGALMMGLSMFTVIAMVVKQGRAPEWNVLNVIGAVFAAVLILVSLVFRQTFAKPRLRELSRNPPDDWRRELAPLYQSRTIITNALLEGAGFFNAIVLIITAHWLNLTIIGVLLALMAVTFPSQSQFESWAEQVQRDHS